MSRDCVIEARLDSRDLATCAQYLTHLGTSIGSNSELLWYITQLAVYAIGGNEFENLQEARNYLAGLGLTNLNRSGRNKDTLHKALQVENLQADGFDPNYIKRKNKAQSVAEGNWDATLKEALNKVKTLVDKD